MIYDVPGPLMMLQPRVVPWFCGLGSIMVLLFTAAQGYLQWNCSPGVQGYHGAAVQGGTRVSFTRSAGGYKGVCPLPVGLMLHACLL